MTDKWDARYLRLAYEVASWSKDTTKVGAYVVAPGRKPKSHGYNGIPRGLNDEVPHRRERPTKYYYMEHAERNAIYNADQDLTGCTMYVTHHPCADCARAIIQEGIAKVVIDKKNNINGQTASRFPEMYQASQEMLQEAGIEVVEIDIKDDNE